MSSCIRPASTTKVGLSKIILSASCRLTSSLRLFAEMGLISNTYSTFNAAFVHSLLGSAISEPS